MVQSLATACDLMLGTWELDEGLSEGYIWNAWVQGISELMEHHGLPSAARKDSDKRRDPDIVSPFVSLIKEFQKHIPERLRRHDHSPAALEQAIYRARKRNWWPVLLPTNIREKHAAWLESVEQRVERYEAFKRGLRADPNWVERHPGSFVRADSPFEKIMKSQCEQEVAPESQHKDDAASRTGGKCALSAL
jgi:hypothetical protein